MVYQLEEGAEGTRHLQGYIEMPNACRLPRMKKLIPRAHFEPRRGTKVQAVTYATKEDTRVDGPWIHPTRDLETFLSSLSNCGSNKSSDLDEVKKLLDEGCSEEKIADENFGLWVRHYRAFREYKLLKTVPRNHEVDVIVIQGPTGTGKSRFCMDTYPDAYWKQRSNWWDGYSGERVVIVDEFYGWLPFDLLLRLCDRYPLMLETKGGQCQCVCDTVVITTNSLPNTWYKKVYFKSFVRRVKTWMVMPQCGIIQEYTNYEMFIQHAVYNEEH